MGEASCFTPLAFVFCPEAFKKSPDEMAVKPEHFEDLDIFPEPVRTSNGNGSIKEKYILLE